MHLRPEKIIVFDFCWMACEVWGITLTCRKGDNYFILYFIYFHRVFEKENHMLNVCAIITPKLKSATATAHESGNELEKKLRVVGSKISKLSLCRKSQEKEKYQLSRIG